MESLLRLVSSYTDWGMQSNEFLILLCFALLITDALIIDRKGDKPTIWCTPEMRFNFKAQPVNIIWLLAVTTHYGEIAWVSHLQSCLYSLCDLFSIRLFNGEPEGRLPLNWQVQVCHHLSGRTWRTGNVTALSTWKAFLALQADRLSNSPRCPGGHCDPDDSGPEDIPWDRLSWLMREWWLQALHTTEFRLLAWHCGHTLWVWHWRC